MSQEKLLSPKELGALVGLSTAQIRALMNDGRLEFVEITPKTRLLTMTGWERFQKRATPQAARGREGEGWFGVECELIRGGEPIGHDQSSTSA